MAVLVELDEEGRKIYRGFLSSEETKKADLLLGYLKDEIPKIGEQLFRQYGDGVLYKYFMGKRLSLLLDEYEIEDRERIYFWNEIKNFATDKVRKRDDGENSKTRKFYEQCYQLSMLDQCIVEKLSWRQWQDLLDRKSNREDERIFLWIGVHEPKIKEKEWRPFEKALHAFLKNKDTSVFEDDELFDIYEMLLLMAQQWINEFEKFQKDFPHSAKLKTKAKWESKYYDTCLKCRKANRKNLSKEDCVIIFETLMKAGMK